MQISMQHVNADWLRLMHDVQPKTRLQGKRFVAFPPEYLHQDAGFQVTFLYLEGPDGQRRGWLLSEDDIARTGKFRWLVVVALAAACYGSIAVGVHFELDWYFLVPLILILVLISTSVVTLVLDAQWKRFVHSQRNCVSLDEEVWSLLNDRSRLASLHETQSKAPADAVAKIVGAAVDVFGIERLGKPVELIVQPLVEAIADQWKDRGQDTQPLRPFPLRAEDDGPGMAASNDKASHVPGARAS